MPQRGYGLALSVWLRSRPSERLRPSTLRVATDQYSQSGYSPVILEWLRPISLRVATAQYSHCILLVLSCFDFWLHVQTVCKDIVGWGRKKRDADDKDDIVENVTCGTTLRVKSPHLEPQGTVGCFAVNHITIPKNIPFK